MSSSIFRIDKFIVPEEGKHEFVQRMRETHEFLRILPGFVRDLVVEKTEGAGVFNYVTLVEWESEEAISAAKSALHAHQAARNFSVRRNYGRAFGLKPTSRTIKKLFCRKAHHRIEWESRPLDGLRIQPPPDGTCCASPRRGR